MKSKNQNDSLQKLNDLQMELGEKREYKAGETKEL